MDVLAKTSEFIADCARLPCRMIPDDGEDPIPEARVIGWCGFLRFVFPAEGPARGRASVVIMDHGSLRDAYGPCSTLGAPVAAVP